MEAIFMILGGLILLFVGMLAGYWITRKNILGTLVIDHSDPECPFPFLEGSVPLSAIEKMDTITLKVESRNYISQE